MKLSELAKVRGVYLDQDTVDAFGNYYAYIDDQSRIVLCLGSRKAGEVFLHKYLLPDSEYVDHKNGNQTDCRKDNLRPCTLSQNQANRKININNTSGYKGVRFHKAAKKFQARITHMSKEINLGLYVNIHNAARAYNTKALELFGEFAKLNEVPNEVI